MKMPINSIVKGNGLYLAYLIFISIIKPYVYYQNFGILILNYMTVAESLFYFINELIFIVIGIVTFVFVFYSLGINNSESGDLLSKKREEIINWYSSVRCLPK